MIKMSMAWRTIASECAVSLNRGKSADVHLGRIGVVCYEACGGTADSFLKASNVLKTRYAHQVTIAGLHELQHQAYEDSPRPREEFNSWCKSQASTNPMFKFWTLVMELQPVMLALVRSFREGDFKMYVDSLTALAPWLFALDMTNYSR